MDNAGYATLTRQSGLMRELQIIANNIANTSTTGFKSEGAMFSEHVAALGGNDQSLSMANSAVRATNHTQGALARTGAPFDLAIEGEGFFQVLTPQGERLTRAGSFTPNEAGDLVTMDGYPILGAGGAPVFVPPDAGAIAIGADGTISAGGDPIGQIGLVLPEDPAQLTREGGTFFVSEGPVGDAPDARMIQGFLEQSNVNPMAQIGRMIEVQRAYELGQSFLEQEHERIGKVIDATRR